MKKSFLLLISSLFLVTSCGNEGKNEPEEPSVDPCPSGEHVDLDENGKCDICGFPVEYQHATTVGGDPTANFMLKIGETRTLTAKLSPTPERDKEKYFTWKNQTPNIVEMTLDETKSNVVTIKGLKEGSATLVATNTYNESLTRTFTANVIDFDENNSYLWQFASEDVKKFGTDVADKGNYEGVVNLGNMNWMFTRSNKTSLRNGGSTLSFGKGSEPETHIKLEARNNRKIKNIGLETSSANGLATCVVKIGDTEVINRSTEKHTNDNPVSWLLSDTLEGLEGDLSIEFFTPAYDPSKAGDESYLAPGAVNLKTILVKYEEEEEPTYKAEYLFDLKAKFDDTSDADFSKLTTTAKAMLIDNGSVSINFEKIKKPASSDSMKEYALSNGAIEINVKNTDEVIRKIDFEYQNGSTVPVYTIFSSPFGGAPFIDVYGSSKTGSISKTIFDPNANAVLLQGGTNYVGLKSIKVYTIEGEHAVIDTIKFDGDSSPYKVNYKAGEVFDCQGLGCANVTFVDENIKAVKLSSTLLTYYDIQSYENPSDHSGKSINLRDGSTSVVGIILNHEIEVNGISVEIVNMTLTRVKNVSEITSTGKYMIASPTNHAFVLGNSGSDINTGKGCNVLSDVDFGETLEITDFYMKDLFTISSNSTSFIFSSEQNKTYGFTEKYNDSTTMSCAYKNWEITINEETGIAAISMTLPNDMTYYLGFNKTLIKPYTTNYSNIALYKLSK